MKLGCNLLSPDGAAGFENGDDWRVEPLPAAPPVLTGKPKRKERYARFEM